MICHYNQNFYLCLSSDFFCVLHMLCSLLKIINFWVFISFLIFLVVLDMQDHFIADQVITRQCFQDLWLQNVCLAAECLIDCRMSNWLQNVPVEDLKHEMEWFGAWMECCMEWVKMDNKIWCNGIWMKWIMEWNGSQLMKWSEVWEVACNSWYVLFNCRKTSNFKKI